MFRNQIAYPQASKIIETIQAVNDNLELNGVSLKVDWSGGLYTPDQGLTWWVQIIDSVSPHTTSWVLAGSPQVGSFETLAEIEGVTEHDLGL